MADESSEQRLVEIFAKCTGELLALYGVKPERVLEETAAQEETAEIAAFSGFGNDDLRGSYTLQGSTKLFSRLHPIPPTMSPRDLADWACEVVNQSVGRFRNRMTTYGISLAISVPQSALGSQMRLSSSLRAHRKPIAYLVEGMLLQGWLELEMKPGFKFAREPLEQKDQVLNEGAMVIF
jgi:hypothetical protein